MAGGRTTPTSTSRSRRAGRERGDNGGHKGKKLVDADLDGLARQIRKRVLAGERRPGVVNLVSFGFRYGTPEALELLFDVRPGFS